MSQVVWLRMSNCIVLSSLVISMTLTLSLVESTSRSSSSGCQCAIRKVLAESELQPCPRVCNYIYKPVCGYNPCEDERPNRMFRTFSNACELEASICDGPGHYYYRVYEGTCVMDHQDETSCLFQPDR